MPIFLIFGQFCLFFLAKKSQKRPKSKNSFCWVFFCWEAFTYHISENFIKRFEFCQFSSFLVNLSCFFNENHKKIDKVKKSSIWSIFFCWEDSTYQISENFINGLNFANFLHFWLILAVLWPKKTKKGQNRKSVSVVNFHLLRGI